MISVLLIACELFRVKLFGKKETIEFLLFFRYMVRDVSVKDELSNGEISKYGRNSSVWVFVSFSCVDPKTLCSGDRDNAQNGSLKLTVE